MILGRFELVAFESETVALAAGDTLVFFTDGVTERRRADGEMFGDDRLRETIARTSGGAGDLARAIVAAADEFAAQKQEDDVTVVVVRLT